MKTKVQIVQELLDKQAISAEDAVVLLMKDQVFIPYERTPFIPYDPWPYYPSSPIWQVIPGTTCANDMVVECGIN